MSNNFPILIEAEESAVGAVLRLLHKTPGIVGIHLQLEAAATASARGVRQLASPPAPRQQPRKPPSRFTGDDRGGVRKVIAAALLKAPLHFKLLGPLAERAGYSAASVNSALMKMASEKEVVRTAPGTYRISVKGEKKYGVGVETLGQANRLARAGLRPLILKEIVNRGSIEHKDLRDHLLANGFSDANMYNMVPKMREEGLLKRSGDTYTITEAGQHFLAELSVEPQTAENPVPALEDQTENDA